MRREKISINYRVITVNTVLVLLIVYFIFHSLSGDRGVFAYFRLKRVLGEQTQVLAALKEERAALETNVRYLYPNSLNVDYLDELARRDLGLIGVDEKTIYIKRN